jgi:putative membrane-bound dehydrogenase-like protein
VAEAPAISAPSVICAAPDGRIFVGQDYDDMGSPSDSASDRILCIHPDGKINVFATNLHAVFGLAYIDGKVYVHHSPKYSVFDDVNSFGSNRVDLIASDNPHPWLPSFNDHIPSGITLAMDGYLYCATGDKGMYGAVGPDGRKLELRGGVFRMRPNGTELEVYCTGTRNHLQVAINSEDEMFTYDNTDDGGGWWVRLTHMVDGGFYGYPFNFKPQRPFTLWMMTDWGGKTGAPTGGVCYDEDALPQEYHGNLFMCDWACRTVVRVFLTRDGATYQAERFLCPDSHPTNYTKAQWKDALEWAYDHPGHDCDWVRPGSLQSFKPVGICVTPDGMGFYITDWGLNGWKTGEILGRIFKLSYTGKSLATPKPKWYVPAAEGQKFNASTGDLIRALSHPSEAVRLVAQRRLADRGSSVEGKVAAVVKKTSAKPEARWSAIWTLDAIDGGRGERNVIIDALKDKDPTVQSQAARELGTRQAKEAVQPLIAMLEGTTNEILRFRAATALGRIADPAGVEPLKLALVDKDLFARYADFKALNRLGLADPAAWPQIVRGLDSVNPRIREGTFFATRETYDVGLMQALRGFMADPTIPTEPRTNVLNLLSSLYLKPEPWNGDWWNTVPVNGPPPAKTESWAGSPIVATTMREALSDPTPAIRQIVFDWVKNSHDPSTATVLRAMYERETNVGMRAEILRALPPGNSADSQAIIGPILKDPHAPRPLVEAAIEYVQKTGDNHWDDDLVRMGQGEVDDQLLVELFQYYGNRRLSATAPLMGKHLNSKNPALRQHAAIALKQISGDAAITEFIHGLDDPAPDVRDQSIEALGTLKAKAAIPRLIKMAATNSPDATAAIAALARMPDLTALDVFLDGLASPNSTIRLQCRNAMGTLRDAALPRIEAKLAITNGLSDETIVNLRQVYQDSLVAKKSLLFKVKVKQIPLSAYTQFALDNPGNSAAGRMIFTNANGVNCIRCHAISGQGGHIGPDLAGLAIKQNCGQIIESVLYPSKVILDGYQQVYFHTKDDEDYAGIVRSETADVVTIVDNLGATTLLKKSNIASRKISQVSLMPEGLQSGLSLDDFANLIAYIENPNQGMQRPMPPPINARGLVRHPPQSFPPPSATAHHRTISGPAPAPSDPAAFLNLPPLPLPNNPATGLEDATGNIPTPIPVEKHRNPKIPPPPLPPMPAKASP